VEARTSRPSSITIVGSTSQVDIRDPALSALTSLVATDRPIGDGPPAGGGADPT
jgi:hypothetical protein